MNFVIEKRDQASRMGVPRHFSGQVTNVSSGQKFSFRGVDVSVHGFGCILIGQVRQYDVLQLQIGNQIISFEVMWVESYLGIEQQYRVGLQCLDRMRDLQALMTSIGVALSPLDDRFAA
jgi:hypothetical protein